MKNENRSAECVHAAQADARFVELFERLFAVRDRVSQIDDRELLWLVTKFLIKGSDSFEIGGYQEALLNELEDRLYPEYDGDLVKSTDYGWETPDGPLIYDRRAYEKAGHQST